MQGNDEDTHETIMREMIRAMISMEAAEKNFILKGTICYNLTPQEGYAQEGAYLVCVDGHSAGVYESIPQEYQNLPVKDYGNCLIIPGMIDLHTHAPQYTIRAYGMDYELMEWLNAYTFPEEAHYADPVYADKAYDVFVRDLQKSTTTRVVCFATMHREGTEILMDKLEKTGMISYVGLVEMDANPPECLHQESPDAAAADTVQWLQDIEGKYERTFPIITPRFAPSCSEELFGKLGEIRKNYHLPVQSHLSESYGEIECVKELFPWSAFYGEVYDRYGLFGGEDAPTIMAHCVHCSEPEIELMKKRGVYVAHCPDSNVCLTSGISPVRRFLNEGMKVGLGSDIAGSVSLNMLTNCADVIRSSKMRWRLKDSSLECITVWEALYLATMGGGSFFGKVGSFEKGYEFDAVVLDDSEFATPRYLTPFNRLEQMFYIGTLNNTVHKFVKGVQLF